MRVATANYPIEALDGWDAYSAKSGAWAAEAVEAGADLLVFPEYAGLEAAVAVDGAGAGTHDWCARAAEIAPRFVAAWQDLARRHGVLILSGSLPVSTPEGLVNRAHLHFPDGGTGFQDKQILTPWERANTPLRPGLPLTRFDTAFGRIGVLVCYDSEFPLLGRALDCDLLLVPSCTEALTGLTRVEIGARARALEGQRYAALATLTGGVPGCDLVDANTGRAGIFSPPDRGFPADGIVAQGAMNVPGWVVAEVDLDALSARRADSEVSVPRHWDEQPKEGTRLRFAALDS